MAKRHDSRLHKIELLVGQSRKYGPRLMAPMERVEFVKSLASEILGEGPSESNSHTWQDRYTSLPDLDRFGVRSLIKGLSRFGRFGHGDQQKIVNTWLTLNDPY